MVEKIKKKKGIKIKKKKIEREKKLFKGKGEEMIEECQEYMDRRIEGEMVEERKKSIRQIFKQIKRFEKNNKEG